MKNFNEMYSDLQNLQERFLEKNEADDEIGAVDTSVSQTEKDEAVDMVYTLLSQLETTASLVGIVRKKTPITALETVLGKDGAKSLVQIEEEIKTIADSFEALLSAISSEIDDKLSDDKSEEESDEESEEESDEESDEESEKESEETPEEPNEIVNPEEEPKEEK